ncbi:MAG: type III pantothenate kinase, partial [Lachnospiraceae bacterium]|nr:type III pantothenate kinase [Lachnospiraceae bacterium]
MLFTIDIGNTNMVLGGFEGDKIRFLERLSTDQGKTSLEYALILKNIFEIEGVDPSEVTGAVIASVVPPLTASIKKALEKILSCRVLVVGPGLQTGMGFDVDDPSTVGTDLIVAGAAGIRDYECPLILIDMGTATTISVID